LARPANATISLIDGFVADAAIGDEGYDADHLVDSIVEAGTGRSSLISGATGRLLNGTRQRFSDFNHMRQCGDDVLRITGAG